MDQKMFCYQCEQTAKGTGCEGSIGVCGKTAEIAGIQDEVTGALIGLAQLAIKTAKEEQAYETIVEGLFTTLTNVNFDADALDEVLAKIREEKANVVGTSCHCGGDVYGEYNIRQIWNAEDDIKSLKSLLLFGLRGMAAYAYHALHLGRKDDALAKFLCKGLAALAENHRTEELIQLNMDLGEANLRCMELLDDANHGTYGAPTPQKVELTIEPGPFIIITGHDLQDLEELLKQTEGKGINIYTHGEMLPAHGYPQLKKYKHLKGNFGTAWQNQKHEFDGVPAPILFTTNCLMPQKPSYSDRIFTTGPVSWPDAPHIGEDKDFSAVIQKALELGGYKEPQHHTGLNGGTTMTTGFGHEAILSHAEEVAAAVKEGKLKHIFLVGGCDGVRKSRSYFTEFVKQTPPDTLILTLACGKFRFNDLELGTVAGLPRLMDVGQCNDAYGAIKIAAALAQVFHCEVNDLPLTMILSWYEQKAVAILLSLLHLGIKNIYLGPSLPACLTPGVTKFLVETFQLHPISTPEEDLKEILG